MTKNMNNNNAARDAEQKLKALITAVERVALILDASDEAQELWEAIAAAKTEQRFFATHNSKGEKVFVTIPE